MGRQAFGPATRTRASPDRGTRCRPGWCVAAVRQRPPRLTRSPRSTGTRPRPHVSNASVVSLHPREVANYLVMELHETVQLAQQDALLIGVRAKALRGVLGVGR